jgi:tripartite-type tricarboxylate transporter receptor subunit TctC
VVSKINDSLATALKDPKLREQLTQQGFEISPIGSENLKEVTAQGLVRMKRVIKEGGIEPN